MANDSVAIPRRAINPVKHLSYLIQAALQSASNESDEFHAHYCRQFATLIGLGLTANLTNRNQLSYCQKQLASFLDCGDHFTQCPDQFESLSTLVAESVCSAIRSFQLLGSPRFFDDFLLAMTNIVDPASLKSIEKNEKIRQLLQMLFEIGS